jgi:hypothetical protein
MAANTDPIFTKTPKIAWGTITTANTAKDGTGTVVTIFTAGADGARVDRIVARALGTNVATVLRVFINNGSDSTVAANNTLVAEKTLPSTTLSEVAELANQEVAGTWVLPAGYKINITIGTTVAAGYAVSAHGGDF